MKISQSLIKEVLKQDHCPKQIYFSFVEGRDLMAPSENMILGRYFESEILGACRGGEIQEAKTKQNGEKYKVYSDVDMNIQFAEKVLKSLGIYVENGKSQVSLESELLSGNIDHQNRDLENPGIMANYDLKWTATAMDDKWNGWGDPETRADDHLQATHYTLLTHEITGEWWPFYFLVFGKSNWVKVIRIKVTEDRLRLHKQLIAGTSAKIRQYSESGFKGNGDFNKCQKCPFKADCPDKKEIPKIETLTI